MVAKGPGRHDPIPVSYTHLFAISYLLSIYLQAVKGYSSQTAGFILIAQPALMALLSPLAGRISDRFSPFLLSSIGMALCAGGLFLFAGIGETTSLFFIFAALVITGVGFAFFSSPNTNAVMSCVEEKDYGVASSILATMRSVGHTDVYKRQGKGNRTENAASNVGNCL